MVEENPANPVAKHRSIRARGTDSASAAFLRLPFPPPIGKIRASFFGAPSVANIKSAEKRAKQTVKRRAHNVTLRSRMRTAMKDVLNAVKAGNKTEASANLKSAVPVIDSMVNKGIIHRNAAARYKSGLNARVKALAAK
jgi:small subunit ribosomal protein S20